MFLLCLNVYAQEVTEACVDGIFITDDMTTAVDAYRDEPIDDADFDINLGQVAISQVQWINDTFLLTTDFNGDVYKWNLESRCLKYLYTKPDYVHNTELTESEEIDLILEDSDSVLLKLGNLLSDVQSEIIEPADSTTPAPTADNDGIWTLIQDTPDADRLYTGIYKFQLEDACSALMIKSVSGYKTPARLTSPAVRYTDCDDIVHDLGSVYELDGKQVNQFEIYSDSTFKITLMVNVAGKQNSDTTRDDEIDLILTDMYSTQSRLENLILRTQAKIIQPADIDTPEPTLDHDDIWTLTQDSADTNGLYKGVYKFELEDACSVLVMTIISEYTTPEIWTAPAARYTDCADVVHDLNDLTDLDGKQVKQFELYSDSAFTIALTIID